MARKREEKSVLLVFYDFHFKMFEGMSFHNNTGINTLSFKGVFTPESLLHGPTNLEIPSKTLALTYVRPVAFT